MITQYNKQTITVTPTCTLHYANAHNVYTVTISKNELKTNGNTDFVEMGLNR